MAVKAFSTFVLSLAEASKHSIFPWDLAHYWAFISGTFFSVYKYFYFYKNKNITLRSSALSLLFPITTKGKFSGSLG